jgi:hypothetical protein
MPSQAVSRRLSTAAARLRARSDHVGFVVDKAALGQVFPEYYGSSRQSFHRLLHRGWYNRPVVASVTVDSVALHPKKRNKQAYTDFGGSGLESREYGRRDSSR